MGKFTFDDDEPTEPTFSLYDFRKWLGKHGKDDLIETKEEKEEPVRDEVKEKEDFKEKLRKRRKNRKKKD